MRQGSTNGIQPVSSMRDLQVSVFDFVCSKHHNKRREVLNTICLLQNAAGSDTDAVVGEPKEGVSE